MKYIAHIITTTTSLREDIVEQACNSHGNPLIVFDESGTCCLKNHDAGKLLTAELQNTVITQFADANKCNSRIHRIFMDVASDWSNGQNITKGFAIEDSIESNIQQLEFMTACNSSGERFLLCSISFPHTHSDPSDFHSIQHTLRNQLGIIEAALFNIKHKTPEAKLAPHIDAIRQSMDKLKTLLVKPRV